MATRKAAAKAAAKKPAPKRAPKKAPVRAPEPAAVESVELSAGDAHAVLDLDGKKFRLGHEAVAKLKRAFEVAHNIVNPGH